MRHSPVLESFKNYHLCSLTFRAFIVAVVQFIRAALLYLGHPTEVESGAKGRDESRSVLLMVSGEVPPFSSKNAYIVIAMKGHSLCSSTKDAFKILLGNIAQVGVISTVTFLLVGAGKATVAPSCAIAMFAYLEKKSADYGVGGAHELSSPLALILLALLLGWFVASTLVGVYEMAVDTILPGFCEDQELNKASGQYLMSDSPKKFVASIPRPQAWPRRVSLQRRVQTDKP